MMQSSRFPREGNSFNRLRRSWLKAGNSTTAAKKLEESEKQLTDAKAELAAAKEAIAQEKPLLKPNRRNWMTPGQRLRQERNR